MVPNLNRETVLLSEQCGVGTVSPFIERMKDSSIVRLPGRKPKGTPPGPGKKAFSRLSWNVLKPKALIHPKQKGGIGRGILRETREDT